VPKVYYHIDRFNVPGHVLKLLGEGGLKTLTKLMNSIYETGEWSKDFTEVTMVALQKKTKATKCSDHCTISLIAHKVKILAKILKRRIERKIEDTLGEDQFGCNWDDENNSRMNFGDR
jgi:hypothetical protein